MKISIKIFLAFIGITVVSICNAQEPTIGLLYHETSVTEGYVLFSPLNNNNAYLINNCGEKVREWNFNEEPGATCYLLENGDIMRAGIDSITIHDWNDNLIWSYATTANGIAQNHDIEPLPNGNVLCVVSKIYANAALIAQGRNPSLLGAIFKMEKIIEIQPVGLNGGNIVWEWNFMDHLIQDFDSSKYNYGVVEDHPELLDINFDNGTPVDWTHCNAVDYNPFLDQIIVSSRHLSELYIIDHSTTTAQAASHSGGNSGMGGDFLWRWGNPQVYRHGTLADQKLFYQHDGKWIEPGYIDEGKISVFNNEGDGTNTFSSVHIITPEISNGEYGKENNLFLPVDYEWSWNGLILGSLVHENKQSGVQCLPDGNFLISEASVGRLSELTKTGSLLWSYKNPVGASIFNQFDNIVINTNSVYKAEKYLSTFPGFSGKDMTPQGIIENLNPNTDTCLMASGMQYPVFKKMSVENPVQNNMIRFNKNVSLSTVSIMDINGKVVFAKNAFEGNSLRVNLRPAMYFLQIKNENNISNLKIVIQ